jgi:Glycosyltransferase family 87
VKTLWVHADWYPRCRSMTMLAVLVLSCALACGYVAFVVSTNNLGHDFAGTVWNPGRAVLDGSTPYPDESYFGSASVNPAPTILALAPLSLMSFEAACFVMSLMLLAAAGGALVVLRVRDWFAYAAVLSSFAVVGASSWGNTAALMVFFVALAWRDRRRSWLWLAAAILVKLWMLPLLLWLVLTRRREAALSLLALGVALAAGWAVIGGDGLAHYPERLHGVQDAHAPNGIFVYAFALKVTHSSAAAAATSLGLAAILFAVARNLDERRMFVVLLAACLVASPIVWPWYLVLLIVVMGVFERSESRSLWLALPASWLFILSPAGVPLPSWLVVVAITLVVLVIATAMEVRLSASKRPLLVRAP